MKQCSINNWDMAREHGNFIYASQLTNASRLNKDMLFPHQYSEEEDCASTQILQKND
jgi:hypothetical protein